MNDIFSLIPNSVVQKLAVAEIILCNETTSQYGLILNEADATELAIKRTEALAAFGRLEFAGGTIHKLIMGFCDSPYLSQFNYAETLAELLEIFYYFKNETLDELGDDELIAFMKKSFDESCQGSLELLQTRELENLARKIRFGVTDLDDLGDDLDEDLEGVFEGDPAAVPDGMAESPDDLLNYDDPAALLEKTLLHRKGK